MNRRQIVDYVLQRVGQIDDTDRTACESFTSKRYELIYQSYLWKDSLIAVDVAVDPTNDLNKEGVILVPSMIDRVVAVRCPQNAVRIHGLEEYYAVDYNAFQNLGNAYEFAILSPIWFKWFGYVGLQLSVSDVADNTIQYRITWRNNAGIRFTQNVSNGSLFTTGVNIVTSSDAYREGSTCDVTVTAGTSYYYFDPLGGVLGRGLINGGEGAVTNGTVFVADESTVTFAGNEDLPVGTPLTAYLIDASQKYSVEVESFYKPVTAGQLEFSPISGGESGEYLISSSDTASPKYQRIRLLGIPQLAVTMSILGKKKAAALDFDQEEPELKNIDNALIELVMGDMRDRQRQTGKAQVNWAAGMQLVKELALLETVQAANNSHFMPVDGFGGGCFGPSLGFENGW